ncbi:hypothetical protein Q5P01_015314 [Channa striata]|uniref:Uncharacterized protein n=1 Tax=Channa striata TaxID=64152 RepID=A0AA88SIR1_CHASR|nr:hypothetical protein Q5P01_015314 [Channa striata]
MQRILSTFLQPSPHRNRKRAEKFQKQKTNKRTFLYTLAISICEQTRTQEKEKLSAKFSQVSEMILRQER